MLSMKKGPDDNVSGPLLLVGLGGLRNSRSPLPPLGEGVGQGEGLNSQIRHDTANVM